MESNFVNHQGGARDPSYINDWSDRETIQYCDEWYTETREKGINPATKRKITRSGKVWDRIDKHCQKNIKLINSVIFDYSFKHNEINLPDKTQLCERISHIVNDCWDNPKLTQRASYNSEDGTRDLFNESDLARIKSIKCMGGGQDTKVKDPQLQGLGHSEHKRPLNDVATDFNTLNFFSTITSRMRFIKLIIFSFRCFLRKLYEIKPEKYNSNNLNIMFKGGTTIRFAIKEFLRGFSSELEDYVLAEIQKTIKLSDFDFEIISQQDVLSPDETVKFNILTYLVLLEIRNYLEKNQDYFFDFFQLKDSMQMDRIRDFKLKFQEKANSLPPENFYSGIVVDEVEFSGSCLDPNNKKYSRNLTPSQIQGLNKYIDRVSEESTCRTDFSLIPDARTRTEREQLSLTSSNRVCFISSRKLLKRYGLPDKYIDLALKSRIEGGRFYVTHNPLVEFPTDFDPNLKIKFQLNRIKYSYTVYFHKRLTNDETIYLRESFVGEILDLSHPYNEDRKKTKFLNPFDENLYLQKFTFQNFYLKYWSYSVYGLIKDNEDIIFLESDYKPWSGSKYEKRLTRVVYLYILYYFSNHFHTDFVKKLRNFKKIIKMVENDYAKKYRLEVNPSKSLIKEFNQSLALVSKNKSSPQYPLYKKELLTILKNLYRVLKTEYELTRNPQLIYDRVDPLNLAIRNPSIY
jgi:hypothetical protein